MAPNNREIKIDSELLIPERVKSGEIKLAKHSIIAVGLDSDTLHNVTVDDNIELNQSYPSPQIYLNPIGKTPQPSYSKAWFYADCIAYDHDIPAILYPSKSEIRKFRYRYAHSGTTKSFEDELVHMTDNGTKVEKFITRPIPPGKITETFYLDQLITVLSEIREMRHGPVTFILFKHYNNRSKINLPYWRKYRRAAKEIHIYATALRQADTLSEFLWYYRIIESIAGNNGKKWIAKSLKKILTHDFGLIPICHSYDLDAHMPPKNLLQEYQKRAVRRLNRLSKLEKTPPNVAKYLYNVNRCGIAHGSNIIKGDLTPKYFEVVRDTYLLKMLSRIAIDEKIN